MSNNVSSTKPSLTRVQRGLILGALIALVLGLGYWWYTTLVWEEKEIDLGYSKEARQNDFLAAEIFLRKQGVQATTVKNLSLLDKHSWRNLKLGAQDTLVIINGNKTLTQERYDSLYEWVENGGTLITSTQNPFIGTHTSEEDLLLDDFNIELPPAEKDSEAISLLKKIADGFDEEGEDKNQEPTEKTGSDQDQTNEQKKPKKKKPKKIEKPENYYRCALKETPTPITFASEEKPLQFDFSRSRQFIYYDYVTDENVSDQEIENNDEYSSNEEESEEDYHYDKKYEHLLYFDIGKGSVTIMSDNHIWSNQRIDCHDHAYGLWRLINPEGRVWFLINQDAPSLASILWRNASYGVSAGIIALILWLWANSLRFGPVLVVEQTGRRSLAEHIYASAMLLWRKQQHPQLLNLLRKEILDRLDEQHPNLNQPAGDQRMEFLHQLTGIAQADIKQALFADALHHPQEFAAAIAHLQTIRKQLSGVKYD
ncbi:DUF4350 domain-containing protein [Cellvibrio sp. OA-2007]|uniref:DUF4350 domain-containing protein n=1 Tax=Cellvibrio sp. OA-2007 TaxID=529823 RepID=UPI0007818CEF|nr:DUF4350 domain-containing protein [Cellvibrio sp. OA-2007]